MATQTGLGDRRGASGFARRARVGIPTELFIHGRIRFDADDWSGYCEAALRGTIVVGVRIVEANDLRLYRQNSRMQQFCADLRMCPADTAHRFGPKVSFRAC